MKSVRQFFILSATLIFLVILSVSFTSCKSDDPPLPDNPVVFEAAALGVDEDDAALTVTLRTTRATDVAIPLTISLATEGVTYGTEFTTTPASTAGTLALTIPKGAAEVSFTVNKAADVLLDGDEKITFTIAAASAPIMIGTQKTVVVSFSEILSAGAAIDLAGGGATYSNKVYLDLSANTQTAVLRTSWDLGFYMEDGFLITVNGSTAMMARQLDKNDLTAVTAEDTIGFKNEMSINAFNPDAVAWVDDPTGDLTKTAIGAVSATASENKVYIINRGSGIGSPAPSRGWKKVRILRNGSGYTLQHADIASSTFSEVQVTKDNTYLFKYVHFEDGVVEAEPAKAKWDIAWTFFTNIIPNGDVNIPYTFQDLVLLNRNGVESAKVLTADITYEAFAEANIADLTFSAGQLAIGSDWRVTSPAPAKVNADRFYVVKDPAGNIYKLKFTAILKDGVRGTPGVEFALVKSAQ